MYALYSNANQVAKIGNPGEVANKILSRVVCGSRDVVAFSLSIKIRPPFAAIEIEYCCDPLLVVLSLMCNM